MIRQATEADVAKIRACAEEAFSQYILAIGKKPAPMLADFEAQVRGGLIHVIEDKAGTIAGFISFFEEGDHMHLESLAMFHAHAGKGYGKQLVHFCEVEALRRGLTGVELYTNQLMTANLTIYPRLGYRETERREEHGYQRVFYRKDLG